STARSWLGTTRLPVELHLISDLQQSASPLRFADLEPPPGVRLVVHDVGDGSAGNTFVANATRSGGDTLTVDVRTTSPAMEQRQAVLFIDGEEVGRRPFSIGPALAPTAVREGEGNPPQDPLAQTASMNEAPVAQANVQLSLPPALAPRAHRIEVRLAPLDRLPQDDRYFAVLEHSDPGVLLVSRAGSADDAVYAAAAIGSFAAPRLRVEQHSVQEVEGRALQSYAAVVVTDPAALSSAAATRIAEYANAGGALLITLGPGAAQPASLLGDLRMRSIVSRPTQVAHVDSSHPVLRDANGWQDIRFLRYMQVMPGEHDRVLITLQDGAPLLIEHSMGAGRALVLTSPLAREWNDFATHPLFVRFMADAATYLTGAGAAAASGRVGSVVMTGLTATQGGQIFDPQGRRVLSLNQIATAERLIPDQAGFYEIRNAGGVRWLAVNTDVRESNLAQMSAVTLQRWKALQKADSGQRTADGQSPQMQTGSDSTRVSIGYAILLLALLLALAEMVSANHYLAVRREVPR
ncbi:MAG TPA: hypothetical protein VKB34_22690, partial [Povalibacter sp.]|nr:hypothetical protein [Povalibacter sp.]